MGYGAQEARIRDLGDVQVGRRECEDFAQASAGRIDIRSCHVCYAHMECLGHGMIAERSILGGFRTMATFEIDRDGLSARRSSTHFRAVF
jgi:hypothetical protein